MPAETAAIPPGSVSDAAAGIRKEDARLLARIETIRRMQALAPEDAPANLTPTEAAQRLVYDMITCLTRGEIVLQNVAEALIEHTEELRAHNQLQVEELDVRKRLLAREEARESDQRQHRDRLWGIVVLPASALSGLVAKIANDQRVITALISVIVGGIGILVAGWGLGVRLPE